jgi:hypothetical protein
MAQEWRDRNRSPAAPKQDSANHKPRQLGNNLADAEHPPRVEFGLFLSLFKNVAVGDKLGLGLHHDPGCNKDEQEDGKHAILQISVRVADFEKAMVRLSPVPVTHLKPINRATAVCQT